MSKADILIYFAQAALYSALWLGVGITDGVLRRNGVIRPLFSPKGLVFSAPALWVFLAGPFIVWANWP